MGRIRLLAAVAVLAAPASEALAQAEPSKPSAPAGKADPGTTVQGVTVEGAPPPVRTSIDRRSYSVANDLQATTGSISDALRNVPSVEVDVQGNVSLRGDTNVTIMIDGKPSGMFQGEGKAQALQNLSAADIDRVEVITNPSAAFNPEGSAGIINLVTKKVRKPGANGSVRANLGSAGRQNAGVNGSYRKGKLTLSGDAAWRHDSMSQSSEDRRETLDAAGARESVQAATSPATGQIVNGRVGADYDLDPKTQVRAEVRFLDIQFDAASYETFDETTAGIPSLAYDRISRLTQDRSTVTGTGSFRRTYGDDHQLTFDVTRERTHNDTARGIDTTGRLPAGTTLHEDLGFRSLFWRTQAKLEYSRPLDGGVKLKAGYEFNADDNDYDNRGARGPAAGETTPDPNLTNLFRFDQQIHAVYATYERPFGKLTALAGLRLEQVLIDMDQVTAAITEENDYTRAYPSLHLSYELGEGQQLKASYSRRTQRPQPQEFNPFRIYSDPFNYRAGNPDLKPQMTDSFELGYERRRNGAVYLATLYYRQVTDAVTDVTRDLGGGVFLSTKENLGESRSLGLELVANGKLTRKLSYNLSGNVQWNEIDGTDLGFGSGRRDGVLVGGRANVSWQATDKDFFQLNGFLNSKRLTPQGYVEPMGMLNLGYRHKFNDRLSGVATVQDVLDTFRDRRVIETSQFRDVIRFTPKFRGVYVGFNYSFGGGKPKEPAFDFGAGGGGPPS